MGVSTVLDVIVGVVFVVFLFSIVASGVHELFTWVLATRSKQLWRSIGRLLDGETTPVDTSEKARVVVLGLNRANDPRPRLDPVGAPAATGATGLKDRLFAHPLIRGLEDGDRLKQRTRTRLSHIEPDVFSRALIDVVSGNAELEDTAAFRRALGAVPEGPLRDELGAVARHAGHEIDDLRRHLGEWFDARMDALTRSYRSRTRWWLFAIGLVVAIGFNVDAVTVTNTFYRDEATRALVVAEAEALAGSEACTFDEAGRLADDCRDGLAATADVLDLPVWWDGAQVDGWSIVGWLIAGAAIAQGGPFWYDVLRRLAGFRRSAVPG